MSIFFFSKWFSSIRIPTWSYQTWTSALPRSDDQSIFWQTNLKNAGKCHKNAGNAMPRSIVFLSFLVACGTLFQVSRTMTHPPTPGDGWIAPANGHEGLNRTLGEVARENENKGCCGVWVLHFEKDVTQMWNWNFLQKGPWNELPPPGHGKSIWCPGRVRHKAGTLEKLSRFYPSWFLSPRVTPATPCWAEFLWFHHGPIHCILTTHVIAAW